MEATKEEKDLYSIGILNPYLRSGLMIIMSKMILSQTNIRLKNV